MPFRVREILLVSSLYDSFTFEEEGHISELLLEEYLHRNLWYAPRITRYPTAEEALSALDSDRRFDLIITTMRLGDMDPSQFAREARERTSSSIPIVLIGTNTRELDSIITQHRNVRTRSSFDRIFVWTGDAQLLFAIVGLMEDERNVRADTREAGVEVVLFIEDSIQFASAYLPMFYAELLRQSQSVLAEGLNAMEQVRRMRARPKVLWCETYEQACETYEEFRPFILGIISDVRFPRDGQLDAEAGFAFTRYVRAYREDIPVLLQSHDLSNIKRAVDLDAAFAHKNSRSIPREVRRFVTDNFGFGPFIFRLPDGSEVGRADTLRELEQKVKSIPAESLRYHAERNHFSKWAKARTEFQLAKVLRADSASDYPDVEDLRTHIVNRLREFRQKSSRHVIADFNLEKIDEGSTFAKIGGGSIGGKARGLAFLNTIITRLNPEERWPGVKLRVPSTVVIGTSYFDQFMTENLLTEFVQFNRPDQEIIDAFRKAQLPETLVRGLYELLGRMHYPLAIRSSSMLEDSLDQPFAGVYETYMLSNVAVGREERLRDLIIAVKLVYASAFTSNAKSYIGAAAPVPETEKMAVIVQELEGKQRMDGHRYYPSFSGVARSYNYYPFGEKMKAEDGVAYLALGLGKTVVEGGRALRFCPRYPRALPQFSSVDDIRDNSQKYFYALDLNPDSVDPYTPFKLDRLDIIKAEEDGTLGPVASVYSPEDDRITDGISRHGIRLVTFAPILKQRHFPLPDILSSLLAFGERGMSSPVEIEFAVNLPEHLDDPAEFACLQMRPLVVVHESVDVLEEERKHPKSVICSSPRALGNGEITGIHDIVCVDPDFFDRKNSSQTATQVGELNDLLKNQSRPYLLIGPGRWGSSDPWLGIPVRWGQISGVRVVIETGMPDVPVTPSEGSHFFHNMTSFRVGYLTVNPHIKQGSIDWKWIRKQSVMERRDNGLRWIHLPDRPLFVMIDGRSSHGAVFRSAD